MSNWLYEDLKLKVEGIKSFSPDAFKIPNYITENIKYELFEWQKNALENFLYYEDEKSGYKKFPSHLLFNMATGTGKTLLMASLILYYYKQGFRSFIFFVNQNNIVDKTENNFCNKNHNKFLFTESIIIDGKTINIKKVETFSDDTDNIEIKFTSIHKLHNDVYTIRENQVYLEDLQKRDIVMLGDEAHHLNSDTKKKKNQQEIDLEFTEELKAGAKQELIEKSWEHTILNKILKRDNKGNGINKNALLEFTATIPKGEELEKKYKDKVIYKYDLKEFLLAGYTKEINLLSSNSTKKERILTALLLNWYRQKIALDYEIKDFKGVILFRSAKIDDSIIDFEYFLDVVNTLEIKDFNFLKNFGDNFKEGKEVYDKGGSRIKDIINYIKENSISYGEIINFLKYEFKKENCIITNSKSNKTKKEKTTEEQEKILNSLEDKNNNCRAIFTVYRLTEGWDVLNLFDIVRLHEGRTVVDKKAGPGTISEVQLIGRGVRYFPFNYKEKQVNKRKFDDNLNHPLRILEELFYHSIDESLYITELKTTLKEKGYISSNKVVKKFKLKDKFKETPFFNNFQLLINERIENPDRKKRNLLEIKKNFKFQYEFRATHIIEEGLNFNDNEEDITRGEIEKTDYRTETLLLKDFDLHIIRKAINFITKKSNSLYRFENLKNELDIFSINDLLEDNFLGLFELNIIIQKNKKIEDLNNNNILKCLIKFFNKIEVELNILSNPYKGTDFKFVDFKGVFDIEKEKTIELKTENIELERELKNKPWYVLDGFNGTDEERPLAMFLRDTIGNLEDQYDEIYLLRNEEVYTIHDFKTGKGFQPDFLLFLRKNNENLYFQIFIEPKGGQLLDFDDWKNNFLKEITEKYGYDNLLKKENDDYILIGLPLYNKTVDTGFFDEYENIKKKK